MNPKPISIPPVLILSTGRCGSTMVSEMLNSHPRVLSLSEFFVPLGAPAFAFPNPDGKRMWKTFSTQNSALHSMVKDGLLVSENLYPFDDPQSRFQPNNCPPILMVTLPHLTPDFENLYDELEPLVQSQPRKPVAEHYRFLFETLANRLNRDVWIERSGGSLMHAAKLLKLFSDARVIHVYRDGRDTAISMSRHRNFQILIAGMKKCGPFFNARREFLKQQGSVADYLIQQLVFSILKVEDLLKVPVSLADYGAFWNELIEISHDVLSPLPPDRLLNLRFEDMQKSPHKELARLIQFIDPSLEDNSWLERNAAIPRPARSRFLDLPAEERDALTKACQPGLELLGYPFE